MPDLKAAAKLMLDAAAASAEEMKVFRSGEWHDQAESERDGFLLAAQALEAWAWQQERGVSVEECSGKLDLPYGKYRVMGCDSAGHLKRYYADTPLGAILAAMEGREEWLTTQRTSLTSTYRR